MQSHTYANLSTQIFTTAPCIQITSYSGVYFVSGVHFIPLLLTHTGVLDFYFFVGESGLPDEVISSYHEMIGRPVMPPYWVLGYHQCRWGYRSLEDVKDVLQNFKNYEVWLASSYVLLEKLNLWHWIG